MVNCIAPILLVVVSGLLHPFASAQLLCDVFTVSDIGSTTMITADVGLLPVALGPLGEAMPPRIPAMVQNYSIVCDATGSMRNTSSYVSVVVQFVCDTTSGSPTLQNCDGTTSITRQYQFRCGSDNRWGVTNIGVIETVMPTATLNTPLNNRCVSCVDAQQTFIDQVTHCSACPSNINCNQGQMRCYQGPLQDQCCNYYMSNACVATCPDPLVGDGTTFDCGCGQLSLENGTVSYTNRYAVGSVATHTCNTGFRREGNAGNAARTCTESGWDGQNVTCEFVQLIQCPDLTGTIENGQVIISSADRGVNSKATYTCDSDYELKNGDRERNCQMDGTWDGTEPKCNKKSDLILGIGPIVGIAIAGLVVLLALIALITTGVYFGVIKPGQKNRVTKSGDETKQWPPGEEIKLEEQK